MCALCSEKHCAGLADWVPVCYRPPKAKCSSKKVFFVKKNVKPLDLPPWIGGCCIRLNAASKGSQPCPAGLPGAEEPQLAPSQWHCSPRCRQLMLSITAPLRGMGCFWETSSLPRAKPCGWVQVRASLEALNYRAWQSIGGVLYLWLGGCSGVWASAWPCGGSQPCSG